MSACLICSGGYEPHRRLPGLFVCRQCGFVTAGLDLSREQAQELYCSTYFSGGEYRDYLAEERIHRKNFADRLRVLTRHVDHPQEKELFEVGCAYGFFLDLARSDFASVAGIDLSVDAVEYARGRLRLNVTAGEFLDVNPGHPDVVCLWDTIEHVSRPDLYVEKLSQMLKPGSVVAMTTGDISSVVSRLRGPRWRQIHPPTHLHYFSKATLGALLAKYGFDVCFAGYAGGYRTLDTAAYITLCLKRPCRKIYDALKKTGVLGLDVYVNLADIVYMIGRKR